MSLKSCLERVSKKTEIPIETVKSVYMAYWKCIADGIRDLPLKEDLSEEDFKNMQWSWNIPNIGKLSCSYKRMKRVKERFKILKENGRYVKSKKG